ncbi:phosphate ABC transporter permease subunit PstC [Nevskia soli]|jgi:phosphate transport system permease protein|uniref:phosphate ABC transporter permease subunit PstC n=1 Tax=Nevskia soli TaxID=418856 RepID=UPI0015D80AE5|nr:phosphate ABC transporter permease subunit PstC [Nevskia soli]
MPTSVAVSPTPAAAAKPTLWSRLKGGDQIAYLISITFAALVLLLAVAIFWVLWNQSAMARHKFGIGFFTSQAWDHNNDVYGALPFIYGTLLTSVLALLISIPLGVGAAIFLAELAPPRLSNALTFLVELLAAVPSVIYGLLAIFTVVPLLRDYVEPALKGTLGFLPLFSGQIYGFSYLAAGLVLAIMTFPFIISVSRESLLDVPRDQREAALALGATHWESTWDVVVPFARLGIMGSIFLGLARALGETMAVTMVIGNSPRISASLFASGYTIAAAIANEFAEASSDIFRSSLIYLGLVLFLLTIVINGAARLLIVATTRKGSS